MTKEKLEELKEKVNEHFTREAYIAKEILDSDLSVDEHNELGVYLVNHPWALCGREIQEAVKAAEARRLKFSDLSPN